MASNWIKLEVITPDKPEIFRLAEILNIDPDAALGKVIRFWAWADQQMIDGNAECNARGVTKSAIDRITFMAGFADALIQVGWLVESDGVLSLPNFERHNGKSSKKRAVTNERVTKIRELKRKGDAPRDKCTLSCAINGIHAAFHYLKKNYISGCVMTVPTGW